MAPIQRKRPSSPLQSRFHPLLIALLIIAGGLALYFLIQTLFFGKTGEAADVQLTVPAGNTVYVELADDQEDFRAISGRAFRFLENERVQTRTAEDATLDFFEGSRIVLDEQTELLLEKSREHEGNAREVVVRLSEGQIWVEVAPSFNPRSSFVIKLSDTILLETRDGSFSVSLEDGLVKVAKGSVRISERDGETEVSYKDIGVGQQLSVTGNISENNLEILTPDEWFTSHQDGEIPDGENDDETGDEDEDDDTTTNDEEVQILVPGKNGTTVTVSQSTLEISGTVPESTEKVVVNEYTLQKFEAGDTTFKYTATLSGGNLKAGRNEYTVEAFDEDDELIDDAEIIVIYDSESTDDEEDDDTPDTSTKPVTGTFAITAPNGGNNTTVTSLGPVTISGSTPSNTAKVVVNGYTLSRYAAGNATWSYQASAALGNLKPGANTYQAQAFDKNGKVLATDSITITAPEAAAESDEDEPEDTDTTETTGRSEVTGTVGTTPKP